MINPKMNLNLEGFKKQFFSNVMSAAERMVKKNTEILAAQTRRAAQNSMKRAEKLSKKRQGSLRVDFQGQRYSRPGEPPLEKVGLIKQHLFYAWDVTTRSAFIGPAKLNMRGSVPESLEHGKPTLIETGPAGKRVIIQVPMEARPYMRPALARVMAPANLRRVYEKSLKARKGF